MILALLAIELLLLHQCYILYEGRPRVQKTIWFIACASIWFFTAFRSFSTGNDTNGYVMTFEAMKQITWEKIYYYDYRDPFFPYFVKICATVLRSSRMYLALTAFLSYIGVFVLFRAKAVFPILALFFYVTLANFMFNLTGIRQAISMSMCMLSVLCVFKKQPFLFCSLVFLGMLFHHSAALFFPIYYLPKMQVNQKWLVFYIVGLLICIINFEFFLSYINDLLQYDYDVEEISNGKIFYFILLTMLVIAYSCKSHWIPSDNNSEMFILSLLCVCFWTLRLIGRVAERPSFYFLGVMPIVWVNTLNLLPKNEKRNYILLFSILIALLLFLKRVLSFRYHFSW